MKRVLLIFMIILLSSIAQIYSQVILPTKVRPTITIPKITDPPKIDGQLDDACWSRATKITDFYKYIPVDGELASEKTEAYVTYDREYLYVAFRCHEKDINKIRANITKRDEIYEDDRVAVILDTFNSQRRAYYFESNPLGIQSDALWVEGGDWNESLNFDLVYYCEGELNSEGYTVEFAIPFKSVRFPPGKKHTIGFAVYRNMLETSRGREMSIWPPRSRSKNTLLDQLAQITSIEGIEYSRNFEIHPSFTTLQTGSLNEEGTFNNSSPDSDFGLGFKYGITPNITVDFAYDPDFSQVEADVGQVDINQRYELYYPEKRPFFLEGADIFRTGIEVVYSRRIIDPLFGAKVTGKVGKATFGFLSTLDEGPGREWIAEDSSHLGERALFNILRGKYDLFANSNIGFLMTSRQFADSSNQVVGVDGVFNFKQIYNFNFQGFASFTTADDGEKLRAPAFAVDFSRQSKHFYYTFSYRDLYPDFRADAGFIMRTDIREGTLKTGYRFTPNNKWIIDWTPRFTYVRTYEHSGILVEQKGVASIYLRFNRNTSLDFRLAKAMEQWVGIDFEKQMNAIILDSAPSRYFSGSFTLGRGDSIFYNKENPYLGYARTIESQITLRPTSQLKEELIFTKSTFWEEKGGKLVYDYNLLRSKTTYNISKTLFLRTILEYNTYWKELTTDVLLSYMYNYGTVFFIGYGSLYDRDEHMNFRQNQRSFFIKISYLWRL